MPSKKAAIDTSSPFGAHTAKWHERLVWRAADWKGFSQSLRRKLRKRYARSVTGPFDVSLQNMKFRLYPAENYCDRVIFGRGILPEQTEHDALAEHLFEKMTFVDIGANVGSYSAYVGNRIGGELTLLALEPHPRTYKKLIFNLTANGLPTENVFNFGVGPVETTMELWSDGGSNIGHTSMLKEGTANAVVSVQVPVFPLVDILEKAGIDHIDLLKIDIEGFEDRALAPFFDAAPIALHPQLLLIETVHHSLWKRDLLKMLEERQYEAIFKTAENVLFRKSPQTSG